VQKFAKDAPVHTFDLLTLARPAARPMQVLNGQEEQVIKTPIGGQRGNEGAVAAIVLYEGLPNYEFVLLSSASHQGAMFPFHTWLPDAHVEGPDAISMILPACC